MVSSSANSFDDPNKLETGSEQFDSHDENVKIDLETLPEDHILPVKYNFGSQHCTWGLKGKSLQYLITLSCVVGFSLFGYDQGLMSGIITSYQFVETFPAVGGTSHHATVIQGAVTSCYELGCFFGALGVMCLGTRVGRRPLIIVGSTIIILGTFISIFPFSGHWPLGQFVIARTMTGVGNGINTVNIPMYQSELSDPRNRGRLVNLEGSFVAVGTFIAYWIDFGLSYADSSVSWRLPISLQILFALFVLITMLGLPESPRYLVTQGKIDMARFILSQLHDVSINDREILEEVVLIRDANNRFSKQLGFRDLLKPSKHQYLKRIMIGASSQFFQQFTGCNASIYYVPVLFENTMNLSRRLSLVLGGVFSTVYALFTIPSFFLIEKLGRRPLFLIGAAGQGVAFIITFACLIDGKVESAKGAVFGMFLFITFFAFTLLPLPWVYPPEINSMRSRSLATSISTCTNWLSNFAVVMFTPIFINRSRWGCYLFFAIMNLLYIPVIYFFYPETAGRSLEEIDIIFAKAYDENKYSFIIANEMPKLNTQQIEIEGERLGLYEEEGMFNGESEEEIKHELEQEASHRNEGYEAPHGTY